MVKRKWQGVPWKKSGLESKNNLEGFTTFKLKTTLKMKTTIKMKMTTEIILTSTQSFNHWATGTRVNLWSIVYHFWSFQTLLDNFIVSEGHWNVSFQRTKPNKKIKNRIWFGTKPNQTGLCFDIKIKQKWGFSLHKYKLNQKKRADLVFF